MKLARPDLAAYALVGLCLIALTVLTALGHPVPDVVTYLAVSALGVGGGVAVQGLTGASTPAAEPQPAPPAPAAALTADPATGIIPRIATHAP